MTTAELVALYRVLANDGAYETYPENPVLSNSTVKTLLREAEDEAAVRGRLIHESQNADVCQIAVESGTNVYALHQALYEVTRVSFLPDGADPDSEDRVPVRLVTAEYLDGALEDLPRPMPGDDYDGWSGRAEWRHDTGTPWGAIQTDRSLRLVPIPTADGTLDLEGYRTTLDVDPDADTPEVYNPEIAVQHHRNLVQWVMARAFAITNTAIFDPNKAAQAAGEFDRYFGLRPDSDLRRATRADVPHAVRAHFV